MPASQEPTRARPAVTPEAAGTQPGTAPPGHDQGGQPADAVARVPLWYHTLDVAPGVTTPGWFDLRPIAAEVPWPDLRGARCLDLATYDGFWAFEMESRGAATVLATDIRSHEDWDWLPRDRATGPARVAGMAGTKGEGFDVARQLQGSGVERRWRSVYDLDPAIDGTFDLVVLGALLLHLRDPFRALEAIHGVCGGAFLSIEQASPSASMFNSRRPVLHLDGHDQRWSVPNVAGHRRMLEIAGFNVEDQRLFSEPFGDAHPKIKRSSYKRRLAQRWLFGGSGIPTSAILATPTDVAPDLRARPSGDVAETQG